MTEPGILYHVEMPIKNDNKYRAAREVWQGQTVQQNDTNFSIDLSPLESTHGQFLLRATPSALWPQGTLQKQHWSQDFPNVVRIFPGAKALSRSTETKRRPTHPESNSNWSRDSEDRISFVWTWNCQPFYSVDLAASELFFCLWSSTVSLWCPGFRGWKGF